MEAEVAAGVCHCQKYRTWYHYDSDEDTNDLFWLFSTAYHAVYKISPSMIVVWLDVAFDFETVNQVTTHMQTIK